MFSGLLVLGCGERGETGETAAQAATPERVDEDPVATGMIEPEAALVQLRSGTIEPIAERDFVAKASDFHVAEGNARDGGSYLRVELEGGANLDDVRLPRVHVEGALAVYEDGQLLIRWPRGVQVPETVEGRVYYADSDAGWNAPERWHLRRFSLARPPVEPAPVEGPAPVVERWAEAQEAQLGRVHRWGETHPWFAFARGRMAAVVRGRSDGQVDAPGPMPGRDRRQTDLAELMDTTTASLSIQEALQHDRGLRLRFGQQQRTVPIAELPTIPLESHPFAEMQRQLPEPEGARAEPLADHAPAEFWYLRFSDIRVFLRTLDEADAWATPVQHVLQGDPSDRALSARYQDQLGLGRSDMARHFGHAVVERLAVVGSDPYLREGSDVTVIFDVRNGAAFEEQLAQHMASLEQRVAGIERSSEDYQGVRIELARDPARSANIGPSSARSTWSPTALLRFGG